MVAMRQTLIFAGSSHPKLVDAICAKLGQNPARAELNKFANGETKVQLNESIRDKNVYIVQSGSSKINDAVLELLIMVSACKGGSARSITVVLPYFPYSRQSKKKSHRGAITARMIANLLHVAGTDHVITLDLHANQMQGFFHCPVDNLMAEPLFVQWAKICVRDWEKAVVVSKNPGGTKRVVALADALKVDFGIIMTDSRRRDVNKDPAVDSLQASTIFGMDGPSSPIKPPGGDHASGIIEEVVELNGTPEKKQQDAEPSTPDTLWKRRLVLNSREGGPRASHHRIASLEALNEERGGSQIAPRSDDEDDVFEGDNDQKARDVVTGRLVHGRIVEDDDYPNAPSSVGRKTNGNHDSTSDEENDPMISSYMSTASSRRQMPPENALGGSGDAMHSSEDEEDNLMDPEFESLVTLVGNVRDRPVFIIDDLIDKPGSWIAAAETVVKRGGATEVYCFATHGIFGGDCLQEIEECSSIKQVIVTNAIPIPPEKTNESTKLVQLDVSTLLAEAIRRNRHGESMSKLFSHYS